MRRWGGWVLFVGSLLLLAGTARAATTYVYWMTTAGTDAATAHPALARAQLNGTHVDKRLISHGLGNPCGLAVAGRFLYWVNNGNPNANQNGRGTIGRATLDGRQVNARFIAHASAPCGIAVSGGYIYWVNVTQEPAPSIGYIYTAFIARARLDGSHVQQEFIRLPSTTVCTDCGLAVHGSFIYWSNQGNAIGRTNLDGTGQPDQSFIRLKGDPEIIALAVTNSHIYWASSRPEIGRAALNGSHIQPRLLGHLGTGHDGADADLAVFGPRLYWGHLVGTQMGASTAGGIGRATLSGGRQQNGFINDPLIETTEGLAVGPG